MLSFFHQTRFGKGFLFLILLLTLGFSIPITKEKSSPKSNTTISSTLVHTSWAGYVKTYFKTTGDVTQFLSVNNGIGASDGSGSYANLSASSSNYPLIFNDFGANVPCNATIQSISFNVVRRNADPATPVSSTYDNYIKLFLPDNVAHFSALDLQDITNPWLESTSSWETVTYTHANWGETLTPDMVNDPRFGLAISAINTGTDTNLTEIDAVEISICYEVTNPYPSPISYTVDKENACFDQGSITINAMGGSSTYEYSIDAGATWQTSNSFTNLSNNIYQILVRNTDGSCQTQQISCSLISDDHILQPGDVILACKPEGTSNVTLAIDRIPTINDDYVSGNVGIDVSGNYEPHPREWTTTDLCGSVFSISLDQDLNIYTGTTILYNLVLSSAPAIVSRIDAYTGAVTKIATLPGQAGVGGVEYDTLCNQLFVTNLDDGKIYRLDPVTGATLSTFDPLVADDGVAGLAALGERIVAVTYNYNDNRLYYSVWASDNDDNGNRNTIRSVSIDPATCDFVPSSDILEIDIPWYADYPNAASTSPEKSMPITDLEFSDDGMTMLLAGSTFDSSVPQTGAHNATLIRFTGTTTSWTWNNTIPPSNGTSTQQYSISTSRGSRGGVDFAVGGLDANNCPIDDEQFLVTTADAILGSNCDLAGCVYGFQYMPITGGNSDNSVAYNVARDVSTQRKGVYGDIDVVLSCQTNCICPSIDSLTADIYTCDDISIDEIAVSTTLSNPDSIAFVYFTTAQTNITTIYSSGIGLDTVPISASSDTVSINNINTFVSNGTSPATYYVYAIPHPFSTAMSEECTSLFDEIKITVNPIDTITICKDSEGFATLVADASLTDVVWYNSANQPIGSGNNVIINGAATELADGIEVYHLIATNAETCPSGSCCPIYIIAEECCSENVCMPVSISGQGAQN